MNCELCLRVLVLVPDLTAIIFFPKKFIFLSVEALRTVKPALVTLNMFSQNPSLITLSKLSTCNLITILFHCISYSLRPPPTPACLHSCV